MADPAKPDAKASASSPGSATSALAAPDPSAAADTVVDDAQSAADGIRKASKWIASSLAALPALTLVGNLIKGPGDAGFSGPYLVVGLLLAAGGAYLGIYLFSNVMTPVPLEDTTVTNFNMGRLPGQPFTKYTELLATLQARRHDLGNSQYLADDAKVLAADAVAQAALAEANATELEAQSTKIPDYLPLKTRAAEARAEAESKRLGLAQFAGTAAAADMQATLWAHQVAGWEKVRAQAFRMMASDEVGRRYKQAKRFATIAVLMVAGGVALLALAPKPKSDAAATTTSLVTLHLNQAGKDALSCQSDTISALRIGGTDEALQVITLPTGQCGAKLVKFVTESPTKLGTVEQAKPASLPSGSSSSSPSP